MLSAVGQEKMTWVDGLSANFLEKGKAGHADPCRKGLICFIHVLVHGAANW